MRLGSINQEFFEAGDFLKNFKEDRGKLQCLQSFIDCLDVVWWISNETQGKLNSTGDKSVMW